MHIRQIPNSCRLLILTAIVIDATLVTPLASLDVNAAGELDQTFGYYGVIITNFANNYDEAFDIAIQPDGKILLAGANYSFVLADVKNFALVRYLTNGSLDTSFGNGGKVSTDFFNKDDIAYEIAIQPDGKIVVVGSAVSGNPAQTNFAIARYDANGVLDPTFGIGGKVTLDFFNGLDEARAVAIQPDNKIIVAGTAFNPNSSYDYALARFNSDGGIDTSFDTDGKVSTNINGQDFLTSAALYPNGKLIAVGYSSGFNGSEDISLARYNGNGNLDTTFDLDGTIRTDLGGINRTDKLNAVNIQPDGKAVVVGYSETHISSFTYAFAVARYLDDGNLDNTFGGGDGFTFTKLFSTPYPCCTTGLEVASDLDFTSDGKIIVAGYSAMGDLTVTRYLSDGNLDTTFGNTGRLLSHVTRGYTWAHAVAIQSDGKILAAGAGFETIQSTYDFALVRYESDPNPIRVRSDFDLDAKSDIAVFRPSNGTWYISNSSNGSIRTQAFGTNGDIAVPGDYDGDGGVTDFAVFRPSNGTWYILQSSDSSFRAAHFGTNGDVPVPADYDGDGNTDIAVFRPSQGTWYILRSSDGSFQAHQFGLGTDKPIPGYYDSDGKADIAVFRESNATWYFIDSSTNTFRWYVWGTTGDLPVPADYDGDGKYDISVFRPSNGYWYILTTRPGGGGTLFIQWGNAGDKPVPGDYNGDFKTDVAFWRPSTGNWHISYIQGIGSQIINLGINGDTPVLSAYLP